MNLLKSHVWLVMVTFIIVVAGRAHAEDSWVQYLHPGAHDSHAVAYDAARERLVLFSGRIQSGYDAHTYEWDGQRWHDVASTGPTGRAGHGMVYDAARQRVIMFGGTRTEGSNISYFNDTWEWDGNEWTQVADAGPDPRERHAMAYDSVRQRVVLFGGFFGQPDEPVIHYDDTWEWNGSHWAQVDAGNGPSGRMSAGMTYDPSIDRIVLFGGLDAIDYRGDTWEWDGQQWTEREIAGPPCRAFHTMSYDSDRQRIVVFGGAAPCVNWPFIADQQDTWEWDGNGWTEVATTGPFKRRFAGMAYDAARQRTVLFGGWPANYLPDGGGPLESDLPLGDLWEWDGQAWAERHTTIPRGRIGHRMAYDSIRDVTVLYGGRISIYGFQNETWEWNGEGWTRLNWGGPIGPNNPQERGHHSMAFDSSRGLTWMFGGARTNSGQPLDETWSWDGTMWTLQEPETQPSARWLHDMVYDSARDRIVLFGGMNTAGVALGDTWEWDGVDWTLRSTTGPAPRHEHSMAYDSARGRVVLFSGWDATISNVPYGDTWEWDGDSWTLVSQSAPFVPTTNPPPRAGAAMAYDSNCERVVLRGGLTNNDGVLELVDDTWAWDGSEWSLVTDEGPGARFHEAMVYEETRGRMFIFGGTSGVGTTGPYLFEMWMLREPADLNGDSAVDAADLAVLLGAWGPCPACPADLNDDGDVNASDLAVLLGSWGSCS